MFISEETLKLFKIPRFIIDQFYCVKSFVDKMVKFHLGKDWSASQLKCGLGIDEFSFQIRFIRICVVKGDSSFEDFFFVNADSVNDILQDSNVERYEFMERGSEKFIEYKHAGDFILNTL